MSVAQLLPAMTDPLGRHWQQPKRENVLIDDRHACCTRADFDLLPEYSATIPTGAYVGKMWKRRQPDRWLLCWYAPADKPDHVVVHWRELIVVDP